MRILPGAPREFANETPTSAHLSTYMASAPEMLPHVPTLFEKDVTAFTSLLARRNMYDTTVGVNPNGRYRTVGNRKVIWNVKGYPDRKARIIGLGGVGFNCDAYPTTPGKYQTWVDIYVDTNWFSPRDVLELADNRTQIYVADSHLPIEVDAGIWKYRTKIVTNIQTDYVNPALLAIGMELGVSHTMFEEMSKTAYEKYTFDEKATTHMTIQRLKWSISGTADQYKASKVYIEHNGVNMWAENAQVAMLKRAAQYRENQILFGKSTVTANDEIILKTEEGFDVMGGDGLMNQGDGAWRTPYNNLTTRVLDDIIANVSLHSNQYGTEIAVACGREFYNDFAELMRTKAGIDPKVVESVNGLGKGINLDYKYYEFGGVRIIPTMIPWFDSPMRPGIVGPDGVRYNSRRALFVSLGDVDINEPTIELLQLGNRGWLEGEVNGMNKGGDMANSIDGRSHHALWETGIANRDINGIAELYQPIKLS